MKNKTMTRTGGSALRRSAGAVALAVGVMAMSGGGASAAGIGLPVVANGIADSQALHIRLTLPAVDQLKATLAKLGLPTSSIPNTNLAGLTLDQVVSLTHGLVRQTTGGLPNLANGFATPAIGDALKGESASTTCSTGSCTSQNKEVVGKRVTVLGEAVPGGIGTIEIAGGRSITTSRFDTRNAASLAKVNLNLAPLIGKGGPLAAVGDALSQLTATINSTVLPVVNPVIGTVKGTLDSTLPAAVKETLSQYITVGQIKPIPDLSKVNLLDMIVVGGKADVLPETRGGVKGLLAQSSSKVADISILGGWAKIGAVGLSSESFANGVKGQASAHSDVQIVGTQLGGLLGLDISETNFDAVSNPERLKKTIKDSAPAGTEAAVGDLLAAVDILYNTAGIRYQLFPEATTVDPAGFSASSHAGTLKITIEPKIPLIANGVTPPGSHVPRLSAADYVPTGLILEVELPNASTAVGANSPLPFHSRTGVGTPFAIAFVMLGAAILVRRFVMAR